MATTEKTETTKTDFFADIIAAIDSTNQPAGNRRDAPGETSSAAAKNAPAEIKKRTPLLETDVSLLERLNRMIAAGVSFEIAADDFQAFGASERETVFLQADKTAILGTLQQMFLQKHLLQHSPELLEDFTVEVHERSAIMSDGAPGTNSQAVCEVTRDWIREQIEKL